LIYPFYVLGIDFACPPRRLTQIRLPAYVNAFRKLRIYSYAVSFTRSTPLKYAVQISSSNSIYNAASFESFEPLLRIDLALA
jgi:hypothetical protein